MEEERNILRVYMYHCKYLLQLFCKYVASTWLQHTDKHLFNSWPIQIACLRWQTMRSVRALCGQLAQHPPCHSASMRPSRLCAATSLDRQSCKCCSMLCKQFLPLSVRAISAKCRRWVGLARCFLVSLPGTESMAMGRDCLHGTLQHLFCILLFCPPLAMLPCVAGSSPQINCQQTQLTERKVWGVLVVRWDDTGSIDIHQIQNPCPGSDIPSVAEQICASKIAGIDISELAHKIPSRSKGDNMSYLSWLARSPAGTWRLANPILVCPVN